MDSFLRNCSVRMRAGDDGPLFISEGGQVTCRLDGYRIEPLPLSQGQTKKGSLVEALINVLIGFSINYVANLLIFPLFGMHISMASNLLLGAIYTVISIVRSYAIRRWFNQYIVRAAALLAEQATEKVSR